MGEILTAVAGVVFGLALAAPPGPMNAVIAEESIVNGWFSGVRTGLGAMTADLCFLGGALLGIVSIVERMAYLRGVMVGIGGVLMLYFAYGTVTDLSDGFRVENTDQRGFRKAFALAITNPYQILFWLTAGVALLDPGTVDVLAPLSKSLAGHFVVQTGSIALLAGLFSGIAVWVVGFPAILVATERRVSAFAPFIAGTSALFLIGFGLYFLMDAARILVF
jgi:threonine/homoserine/homoserine lactone efflux protein